MSGREIITLQFGHYSNYVGSHWLNLQEAGFSFNPNFIPDIDNDILFREGLSLNGEPTYTPRLLLVDFKRSFGHLDCGIDPGQVTPLWDEKRIENRCEINNEDKNDFLKDLDSVQNQDLPLMKSHYQLDDVKTWTDYLSPSFHDRTINTVNGFQLGVNHNDYDSYSLGLASWKDSDFQEEYVDKLRLYAEECDLLQGYHVLVDSYNGFCGLACGCLEYIKDEYSKKSVFTVPLYDTERLTFEGKTKRDTLLYFLNSILGMSEFIEFSSIVSPLSTFSSVFNEPAVLRDYSDLKFTQSRFHTSAVIAAALETMSTPYRSRSSCIRMDDIISEVTPNGRVVVSTGIHIPFPLSRTSTLFNVLDSWERKWFESLTPEVELASSDIVSQFISTRGITNQQLRDELTLRMYDKNNPALKCTSVSEMFRLFFNFTLDGSKSAVSSCDSVCRIPPTFPRIFNEDFNQTYDANKEWGRIPEIYSMASIHNTSQTQNLLTNMLYPAKSKVFETLASSCGIESTDFSEHVEHVRQVGSLYNESYWQL